MFYNIIVVCSLTDLNFIVLINFRKLIIFLGLEKIRIKRNYKFK